MSEYIKDNVTITPDATEPRPFLDYTPGYDIRITPVKVNEGATVNYSPLNSNFTNGFSKVNVDVNDYDEVVNLYNKYKEVWELEKGEGTSFVYSLENAEALVQMVNVYLYFNNMEGSNVFWDEDLGDYVVAVSAVEQRQITDNNYIDPAFSADMYPPLEPATQRFYRDRENGYLLANPFDRNSYYVNWDMTSEEDTYAVFYRYQGLWMRSFGLEDFTYSLENAQRLKDCVNRLIVPYTPNMPEGLRTLRGSIMQKFGATHHLLTSGAVSQKRLDTPEYRAVREGPDFSVSEDGEQITGLYDFGSPYATGKNRF